MRRLLLAVSLLSLTACGGDMNAEEAQAPAAVQGETSSELSIGCTGNSWECFCGQYKTQATCPSASRCYWDPNRVRCMPTYE